MRSHDPGVNIDAVDHGVLVEEGMADGRFPETKAVAFSSWPARSSFALVPIPRHRPLQSRFNGYRRLGS